MIDVSTDDIDDAEVLQLKILTLARNTDSSFSVVSGGKVSKYYSITVPRCLFRTLLINAEYFSGNVCHAQTI